VAPPRRTFCGEACVHEWKIRSSPWYVRREVKKRDKGVCRLCGFNVVKAHREWTRAKPAAADRAARKRWRAEKPRWEADHIIPVADGGGECGLENYRLLCRPCHVRVTLEWRANRQSSIGNSDPRSPIGIPNRQSAVGSLQSGVFSPNAPDSTSRRRAVRPDAGGAAGPAAALPAAELQSVGPARDSA
jgi:5-methylcytosine-specific restriction endonuclease McrA